MRTSLLIGTLTCCALLASPGCSGGDGRVTVYPAHGKVLVKGQAAEGATVTFYPAAAGEAAVAMPVPTATTDAIGEFQLRSFEGNDGAPVGEFNVTVVWPAPPPPNATGIFDLKDRLGGRYANPQTSKLTAQVAEGGGEIPPFELQ